MEQNVTEMLPVWTLTFLYDDHSILNFKLAARACFLTGSIIISLLVRKHMCNLVELFLIWHCTTYLFYLLWLFLRYHKYKLFLRYHKYKLFLRYHKYKLFLRYHKNKLFLRYHKYKLFLRNHRYKLFLRYHKYKLHRWCLFAHLPEKYVYGSIGSSCNFG
jgi:hypothetical protein